MWRIDYCGWLVFSELQVETIQDESVSPLNRYVLLVFWFEKSWRGRSGGT